MQPEMIGALHAVLPLPFARGIALVLLGALAASTRSNAQNLVPNPSFEEYEVCPYTIGFQQGDRPLHWYSWYNSPEYFNACAGSLNDIDTLVSVPRNGWTYQEAWDGDAYVGGATFSGNEYIREHIGSPLIQSLVPGCSYQLRFRTNRAARGTYWMIDDGGASNNIGMLLTMSSNAWTAPFPWPPGPDFPVRNFAHLYTSIPVEDTISWTTVEGIITADSAYQYVVLGNFFSDDETVGYPINQGINIAYYLYDHVEVVPLDGCHSMSIDQANWNQPTIAVIGGQVDIHWPEQIFKVEVMDVTGRIIKHIDDSQERVTFTFVESGAVYIMAIATSNQRLIKKMSIGN
jgi:hypothetical protein